MQDAPPKHATPPAINGDGCDCPDWGYPTVLRCAHYGGLRLRLIDWHKNPDYAPPRFTVTLMDDEIDYPDAYEGNDEAAALGAFHEAERALVESAS